MTARISPLFSWRGAICDSDLTPTQRHIALTLSLHMNERGSSCFPSVATLVSETGLSDRAVRSNIKALEQAGWLAVERRATESGRKTSSTYTATVPPGEPAADAGSTPQEAEGVPAADAGTYLQQMQVVPAAGAGPEGVIRGRTQEDVPCDSAEAEPARPPTRREQATEIVTGWWDWYKARNGKAPLTNWNGAVTSVAAALSAGHEPAAVKRAMAGLDIITKHSLGQRLGVGAQAPASTMDLLGRMAAGEFEQTSRKEISR